jgi:hypothetical protein
LLSVWGRYQLLVLLVKCIHVAFYCDMILAYVRRKCISKEFSGHSLAILKIFAHSESKKTADFYGQKVSPNVTVQLASSPCKILISLLDFKFSCSFNSALVVRVLGIWSVDLILHVNCQPILWGHLFLDSTPQVVWRLRFCPANPKLNSVLRICYCGLWEQAERDCPTCRMHNSRNEMMQSAVGFLESQKISGYVRFMVTIIASKPY